MIAAGKVALVTGGASGMGQIFSRRLANAGVRVAIFDVNQEGLEATAAESDNITPFHCDIASRDDVGSKVAQVEQQLGPVDLLVHEALSRELVGIINRAASRTNNQSMEKIMADILDYHASPVEAAESARVAQVRHLLFYHIVPAMPVPGLEAAWLEGVEEVFPNHTLGRDGTTISLPAGSRDVVVVKRGL